jgi:alkylation response protein AidB-like acyl-CoA dehydrogenase
MNFELSDEQQLLADSLRKYLANDYSFDARTKIVASSTGYSEKTWAAFAEMGLLGIPFAEEHGGFGGNAVDLMSVMEVMGESLVVEPYWTNVGVAGRLIATGGSEAQRKRILPALIQGKQRLAFAHTEAASRYDLRSVGARAKRSTGGFILEGEKRAVLHAAAADTLIVSARTSGADGDPSGISLFLVDRGARGVTLKEYRTIDELRAADLWLNDVSVPADALLGGEGQALGLIEDVADYATALLCAEAVGGIRYANDTTLEYLKTRRQFGVPIGTFQALQHRMVEMVISYEQARSMACLACVKVEAAGGAERRRVISAAKIKVADACRHVSQESVQMHGGMGMTEELKVSHTFRRLTMIAQTFGDAEHHLERFAAADAAATA